MSRSGLMCRPWSSVSSPVLTTAVTSPGATTRTRPRRRRAAPTPPARAVITACRLTVRARTPGPSCARLDRVPSRARPESERLRVAVDATPLLGTRTGVGRFCEGALGALAASGELDVDAFAVTWRRRQMLPPLVPAGVRVRQRAMPARPLHLAWAHLPGPAVEWFVGAVDTVHGTNFVVPPSRHAARVVTVHDLTTVRFPELCDRATLGFPRMVRRAVSDGAWVHTPSRFVADEVVAEFDADPGRVRVVYHGVTPPDPPVTSSPSPSPFPPPPPSPTTSSSADIALPPGTARYILAIGTVEPRKDYPGLVRAFAPVAAADRDVALVIAGADGWGARAFHDAV